MSAARSTARPWYPEFILLAALWGSSFLFTRLAVVEFGALPTAAVRVAIASLFLMPLLLMRGHGPQLRQHWKAVFLVGLMNSGIPFACFAFALLYITTGLSSILNATVPLFGALVAWIWLKDRPDGSRILGLVIGFAGVALLASDKAGLRPAPSGGPTGWAETWGPMLAIAACLLATLCYGISASYTRRYLGGLPSLVTATGSQIGATLGLALPAILFWPARTPGLTAWLAILFVGVACTGIAYVLYFRLIEAAGPARALTVTFLVPVFALFYGGVFLGESITPWMIGCGAVILVGTSLSTGMLKLWRTE
jgi:drug/metabolite transporter (DMT)-like permease